MSARMRRLPPLNLPILLLLQGVAIILGSYVWAGNLRAHLSDLANCVVYGKGVLGGQWPYIDFKCEYPPGALIPMAIPALTVRRIADVNDAMVAILPALFVQAAVLCGLTSCIFYRTYRERSAVLRFILLTVLLTPILAYRFDTTPMAITAAVLWAFTSDAYFVCGLLIGFGTLVKLYPAAFLPLVLILLAVRSQWKSIAALLGGFVGMAILPFLVYAPKQMLAPLHFLDLHIERRLQVESTWSGIALIGRDLLHVPTQIVARFGSIEIDNTWVTVFLRLQPIVMPIAYAACIAYCGWIGRRSKDWNAQRTTVLSRMFCLTLCVLLLASKVFSTQYVIWLLPFCVIGSRQRFWLVLAIIIVTLCVFPFGLPAYRQMETGKVICLNVRTLLLMILAWIDARSLWQLSNADPQPSDANSASASAN